MGELEGKVAIITGAASGIGRASVLEFAAEGAAVVAVDITAGTLDETRTIAAAAGHDVLTVVADVADPGAVDRYVEAALAAHGRVDVLFNNAGIFTTKPLLETTLGGARAAAPRQRPLGLPRDAGRAPRDDRAGGRRDRQQRLGERRRRASTASAAYTTSKHAVIGLTRAAAADVGRFGIRVNAICPALARTPMLAEPGRRRAGREGSAPARPLRRTSDPAEQARAAVFLASDRASFVNGDALLVDGGLVNCR